MKPDLTVDGEAMAEIEGHTDVTHLLGSIDKELTDALFEFVTACRALPPKGEPVQLGLMTAAIAARARFTLALNLLTDAAGVDRV